MTKNWQRLNQLNEKEIQQYLKLNAPITVELEILQMWLKFLNLSLNMIEDCSIQQVENTDITSVAWCHKYAFKNQINEMTINASSINVINDEQNSEQETD